MTVDLSLRLGREKDQDKCDQDKCGESKRDEQKGIVYKYKKKDADTSPQRPETKAGG